MGCFVVVKKALLCIAIISILCCSGYVVARSLSDRDDNYNLQHYYALGYNDFFQVLRQNNGNISCDKRVSSAAGTASAKYNDGWLQACEEYTNQRSIVSHGSSQDDVGIFNYTLKLDIPRQEEQIDLKRRLLENKDVWRLSLNNYCQSEDSLIFVRGSLTKSSSLQSEINTVPKWEKISAYCKHKISGLYTLVAFDEISWMSPIISHSHKAYHSDSPTRMNNAAYPDSQVQRGVSRRDYNYAIERSAGFVGVPFSHRRGSKSHRRGSSESASPCFKWINKRDNLIGADSLRSLNDLFFPYMNDIRSSYGCIEADPFYGAALGPLGLYLYVKSMDIYVDREKEFHFAINGKFFPGKITPSVDLNKYRGDGQYSVRVNIVTSNNSFGSLSFDVQLIDSSGVRKVISVNGALRSLVKKWISGLL